MLSALDDLRGLRVPAPAWFTEAFKVPRGSGTVEVDGCPIHYLQWGDPSAPPVLMTHGFLAHARVFAFIAPLLAHRFHIVAFDLSGMGDSGWRPAYDRRAKEAMAVAEAAGLFDHTLRPLFVSHSFGGSVAIETVESHVDRFGGLIICDLMMMPHHRLQAYLERDDIRRLPPKRAKANPVYDSLEAAMARFRLAPGQPCANDYLIEFMARHSLTEVEGGWSWKFDPRILSFGRQDMSWWAGLPKRFADLSIRKAIIHGRNSLLFDEECGQHILDLAGHPLPIVGLADAQHHLMLDQPLAYTAALDAVLQSWSSAKRG